MKDERPRCPKCGSPDVVSYWTREDRESKSLPTRVLMNWYPNARKCVDCGEVSL